MTTNPPSQAAFTRTPFEADDLYRHLQVTDLHCSARSARVACIVKSVDRDNNAYREKLWSYPVTGPGPGVQLTQGPSKEASPRWSPDGSQLAFVSDRVGTQQIHLLSMKGGEAKQLTHFPQGASNLGWMPDGRALLATVAVQVDPDLHGQRSSEPVAPRMSGAAEVAWKLPYKMDGIGYLLAREIHLFKVDAASGETSQLTNGAFDVFAHDVSPDGQRIAYVRTREGRFAHAADLWVCTSDGREHTRLTDSHDHVTQPVWSPSGRYIAFTGAVLSGDAEARLWLLDTASGNVRQLGDVEVADPVSVHWPDGDAAVVFVQAHRGRHRIVRMALDGTLELLLERDHQLGAFGWTPEHFAMVVHHPAQPSELHVCRADDCGGSLRQVSNLNPWWKERVAIQAEPLLFDVPAAGGGTEKIEGWLIRAEGAASPAPLLNDIHGGPAAYALLDFDTSAYWQVLCSQGWASMRWARQASVMTSATSSKGTGERPTCLSIWPRSKGFRPMASATTGSRCAGSRMGAT